ncbi:Catsper1 [Symbiodinium sp. CCMP2592]|nr:Catsper1 [Symbiodinium sp. CCMP2592]
MCLRLEYHDLMSLFEFLDNGDGEITLSEFIEGAARLRGSAKALDIWRIETKVEVLFEEVLNVLYRVASPDTVTEIKVNAIQDVFDNSVFRHIKSNAKGRVLSPMPEGDEEEEDAFGKVETSRSSPRL